jgi:acetyl esterase/lipase
MNGFGWRAVLGGLTGDDVPVYMSPAPADGLSRLPAACIGTGSAGVFRDEATDYATRVRAAGGRAELHV